MRFKQFLDEAFKGYKKLSSPQGDEDIDLSGKPDEIDLSGKPEDVDLNPETDEQPGEQPGENAPDEDIVDDIDAKASEDPDRQGLIRTVQKAHLIYKREQNDGTFEELWIYNIGNMKTDLVTKKAILAGTDIPQNRVKSPDGEQECTIWSVGNAELLKITGLPN